MRKTIVDAGPLIALFQKADQDHLWALEIFGSLSAPFHTTEPVITEAAYFLVSSGASARPLLDRVESGALKISLQISAEISALTALMDRYGSRMDLADATLVRLSEMFGESQVLTTDVKDFSVYRRHGRQTIPLLAPPQ